MQEQARGEEWQVNEEGNPRSFTHADGLQVALVSRPMPPWTPISRLGSDLATGLGAPPDRLERLRIGHHDAFAGRSSAAGVVALHYLVLDPAYRELHHFRAAARPERAEAADELLRGLIRRTWFATRR